MTFTARERFIYHITASMTMHGMGMIDDSKMMRIASLILKNRCRSLTVDDVEEIHHDLEEEVMFSGSVYGRDKKRKEDPGLEDLK